jgi:hypothetical protein
LFAGPKNRDHKPTDKSGWAGLSQRVVRVFLFPFSLSKDLMAACDASGQ